MAILVQEAMKQIDAEAVLEILGAPEQLLSAGITDPPGLTVDGELILQGYVPTLRDMVHLLTSRPPSPHP